MNVMSPRHLKIANWVVLAVLVLAGSSWAGREFALGVLVGGLVVVINFHLLHQALRGTLERAGEDAEDAGARAKAFFAARQLLRFFALLAIIYLAGQSWLGEYLRIAGGAVHRGPDPHPGRD